MRQERLGQEGALGVDQESGADTQGSAASYSFCLHALPTLAGAGMDGLPLPPGAKTKPNLHLGFRGKWALCLGDKEVAGFEHLAAGSVPLSRGNSPAKDQLKTEAPTRSFQAYRKVRMLFLNCESSG